MGLVFGSPGGGRITSPCSPVRPHEGCGNSARKTCRNKGVSSSDLEQ